MSPTLAGGFFATEPPRKPSKPQLLKVIDHFLNKTFPELEHVMGFTTWAPGRGGVIVIGPILQMRKLGSGGNHLPNMR